MGHTELSEPAPDAPVDLDRVLGAVRRSGGLVAGIVVVVFAAVLLVSMMAPSRYRAQARIASDPTSVNGSTVDPTSLDRGLATGRELVTSPGVLAAASRDVPGTTPAMLAREVSARVETDAGILDVMATDRAARRAARIANAVSERFLASRAAAQARAVQRARADLTRQLASLGGSSASGGLASTLRARIGDLAVAEVTAGSDLRIAEPAAVPSAPFSPRPLRSALLGAIVALLLGVLAAVVRDRLRARGPDARELARGADLPLLAVLPSRRGDGGERLRLPGPLRRRREAVAGERTVIEQAALLGSVRLALSRRAQSVVLVCDISAGTGGERVATGLARSLSWAGQDAVLVSAADPDALEPELDRALRAGHRYVILDGPPVAGSAELQLVAWHATAAILVGALGRTTSGEAAAAAQVLDALGVHVLGLVLTGSAAQAQATRADGFDSPAPPPRRPRRAPSRNGHGAEQPANGDGSLWTGPAEARPRARSGRQTES